MHTIGAFEAKTHFSAILSQVERGEEVIITRHGHPIAKIVSIKPHGRKHIREAIKRLKSLGKMQTLGGLDWRSLRDERCR